MRVLFFIFAYMLIYYCNQPITESCQVIVLDPEESHHILRVMRMKHGDTVTLTDGLGNLALSEIADIGKKEITVFIKGIIKSNDAGSETLTVAVAPTKNADRFEWFVEKATEIGIKKIIPLICEHSERTQLRVDRLKKIAVAAMKQSTRTVLPEIAEAVKFAELFKSELPVQRFIAYVEEQQPDLLADIYESGKETIILIGPEGDFSKKELTIAAESGFKTISLGAARLRTETAALHVCSVIKTLERK